MEGKEVLKESKNRGGVASSHEGAQKPLTNLQRRARRKVVGRPLAEALVRVSEGPTMRKAYERTAYECGERVTQLNGSLTTKYCRSRWCVICNAIRTGRAWAAYGEEVSSWNDGYLVTLTIPNVEGKKLRKSLQDMHNKFHLCWLSLRRKGIETKMIRATEVTYNDKTDTMHPHLHCLVKGRQAAVEMVRAWLKRFPKATNAAQDIRKADKNVTREVFKYCVKLAVETKDKDGMRSVVPPVKLNVMFEAMRRLRLWAAVGIESALKEMDENEDEELELNESTNAVKRVHEVIEWEWMQEVADWCDLTTGEVLSEYEMSDKVKVWVKKLENLT